MLAALVTASVFGATVATPKIIGDASDERCMEARSLATSAFKSTSASLLWPIPAPRSHTKVILSQGMEDISGGDALTADPKHFTTVTADYHGLKRPTYWGRNVAGRRLVVVDQPVNWKGDWYSVYLLDPGISPQVFTAQWSAMHKGETAPGVVIEWNWNPPIILTSANSGDWIIDRGQIWEAMPDWQVHVIVRQELETPCRISFGYSGARLGGLPMEVRRFARYADEALGPGRDEGTLRPTGRIRVTVAKSWANAALRPWALTDEPYNSRVEVDRGLAAWARPNRQRAALRRRMIQAYGSAQRALVFYYASRFKVDPSDARRLSRHVMDHMLRSHFVFSKASPPPAIRVHDIEEHEALPQEM
jgi:hypothetical protein